MSLYDDWKTLAEKDRPQKEHDDFWKEYFLKEKENYALILDEHTKVYSGKLSEVAKEFSMDSVTFTGFLDGINTSLVEPLDLDGLSDDTEINLNIDFEKLYYNMLDAKADWLYNLTEWEDVLSLERRKEITKEFRIANTATSTKIGRNDPCTCGSGKKYKKCCGK